MYLKATLASSYDAQTISTASGDVSGAVNSVAVAAAVTGDITLAVVGTTVTITDNGAGGALTEADGYSIGNVIQLASATNADNDGFFIITGRTDDDEIKLLLNEQRNS